MGRCTDNESLFLSAITIGELMRGVAKLPSGARRTATIAATALHHRLTLVTRNTRDFRDIGIPLIDPWEE